MGVFKRGRLWWIRYWHTGREFRESVSPYKRDAEELLGQRREEIRLGKFRDPRKRCVLTLSEFVDRFLDWSRQHKRSWKRDKLSMRNLCASSLGETNLKKIDVPEVEAYKRARMSGVLTFGGKIPSPRTVNIEIKTLHRALSVAVAMGILAENPLAGGKLKTLKEPEGRIRYLKPEEIDRLLAKCAVHLRPLVRLGLLTGMRRSEITGLRWEEVDLARGVVMLPGERTKNGRARPVPLNQDARRVLLEAGRNRLESCPRVFHKPDGSPIGDFKRAFNGACRRAGIHDFKFHDTRHCFASALAMRGVPLQAIGEILGHRSESMTKRYAHLSPQVLQAAAEQASAYLHQRDPEGVARLEKPAEGDSEGVNRPGSKNNDGRESVIPLRSSR